MVTGQKPVITKARKAISNFKLREGMPIGAMVTLSACTGRNRLVNVSLARVRDFRGVSDKAFDGRGGHGAMRPWSSHGEKDEKEKKKKKRGGGGGGGGGKISDTLCALKALRKPKFKRATQSLSVVRTLASRLWHCKMCRLSCASMRCAGWSGVTKASW